MARKKISELELATDVTASDFIQIVDVEDSGMAVSGTNKKATAGLLANQIVPLITNGTFPGIKLADEAVTGSKIAGDSITSSHIVDGTIVNSDVNANAAIAGTKISPNFGAQAISTTSAITCGDNSTISTLSIGRGKSLVSSNTAIGKDAINPVGTVTSTFTTAIGFESLQNVSSGTHNTCVGYRACKANTTGDRNTCVGSESLLNSTDRVDCTAVGYRALANNNSSYNTAVGSSAMGWGSISITGGDNVAVGTSSLFVNASGYENVAIGNNSLSSNSNGIRNTAIGHSSMSGSVSIIGSAAIGYNSTVTGNFQIQLGDSGTTPYAYATLQVRSDVRDKTEIRDTQLGLDFISSLRPVDYKWDMREDYRPEMPEKPSIEATEEEIAQYEEAKAQWLEAMKLTNIARDGSKKRNRYHHGLIAQEVKSVIEETGVDFGGFQDHSVNGGEDVFSIGYGELVAPLIKAVQELKARVEELENS
jgi:hypothetical protein